MYEYRYEYRARLRLKPKAGSRGLHALLSLKADNLARIEEAGGEPRPGA
jgi:hypothetical protein